MNHTASQSRSPRSIPPVLLPDRVATGSESDSGNRTAVIRPASLRHSDPQTPFQMVTSSASPKSANGAAAERLKTYVDWLQKLEGRPVNELTRHRPNTRRESGPSTSEADRESLHQPSAGPVESAPTLPADMSESDPPNQRLKSPTPPEPGSPTSPSGTALRLDLSHADPDFFASARSHLSFPYVESEQLEITAWMEAKREHLEIRATASADSITGATPAETAPPTSPSIEAREPDPSEVEAEDHDADNRLDVADISDEMLRDIVEQRVKLNPVVARQTAPIPIEAFVGAANAPATESRQTFSESEDPNDTTTPVSAADKPSVVVSSGIEIPVDLAAWDVSDFRWPVITNQMIVSGGTAIGGLLSAAMQQMTARPRRICVSGVARGLGITSIAISVARWAAASGLRTLLIDADVASPSLSGKVGMAADMSWLKGVHGDVDVSELIIRSQKSDLCLMPLASSVSRMTWPRFIFDNLGELIEPIQDRFDLILIDTGPASQLLDELSTPDRLVDGVLLLDDPEDPRKLSVFQTRLTTFGIERFIIAENRAASANSQVA